MPKLHADHQMPLPEEFSKKGVGHSRKFPLHIEVRKMVGWNINRYYFDSSDSMKFQVDPGWSRWIGGSPKYTELRKTMRVEGFLDEYLMFIAGNPHCKGVPLRFIHEMPDQDTMEILVDEYELQILKN